LAQPKLRLLYFEDENNESYFYLEKSEGLRVIEILKLLPQLTEWTPIYEISAHLKVDSISLLRTVHKLVGVKKIDVMINGARKVIRRFPVLLIKKDETVEDSKMQNFLRPVVYIRNGIRSSDALNRAEIHNAYSQLRNEAEFDFQ
jgi:hypothetical protein